MKQTMLICDRCGGKADSAAKEHVYWGTISAGIQNKTWGVGRRGAGSGTSAHLCPGCIQQLMEWWRKK